MDTNGRRDQKIKHSHKNAELTGNRDYMGRNADVRTPPPPKKKKKSCRSTLRIFSKVHKDYMGEFKRAMGDPVS